MHHLQHLHFTYPGTPDQPVFTDFSANIPAGVTLVCGGDGCGKSTLLKFLAGALTPDAGDVLVAGGDSAAVFWLDPRTDALDQTTVAAYFAALPAQWPALDTAWLAELVEGLGLQPHMHKQLFMLSTGSKRKVFLAAALASGAALTLLDEPFAALDAPSIRCATQALNKVAAQPGRACVMADYVAPMGVALAGVIALP